MARGTPPPAAIASPLIATDFGEARNATTSATSAASTRWRIELPSAIRCRIDVFAHALRLGLRRHHRGGALGPGLAGMDDGDVDAARAELVGEVLGQGRDRDVADAADGVAALPRARPLMLTIRPQPRACICGATARAVRM